MTPPDDDPPAKPLVDSDEPLPAPASASASDLAAAVGAIPPVPPPRQTTEGISESQIEAELAAADEAERARKQAAKDRKREEKDRKREAKQSADESLDPAERAERRHRRRNMIILAISIAVGVIVTAFVILGRINQDRYFLACSATQIRAEQGRGFPPWGSAPLDGPQWKPIAIPPSAECRAHEADDLDRLTDEYLASLVEQAQVRLTATDPSGTVTDFDIAAAQLEQALLLTRDPRRAPRRADISRLLGDVEYWRAVARLRAATDEIDKAAGQFDTAGQKVNAGGDQVVVSPGKGFHHVDDAAAWSELARRTAAALRAGPHGQAAAPPTAGSGRPTREQPPFGVALPVETPDAAPAPPPEATPDAGLPTGGVLL